MKRIFYNNKLKKLFISLSLVVMLFVYIMPFRTYAAVSDNIDVVAQALKDLIEKNKTIKSFRVTKSTYDLNTYKKVINTIKNADERNSVTSEGKVVYIKAISEDTLNKALGSEYGIFLDFGDNELYELCAKEGLIMEIIDPNDIPEGEEDTRTEEQKVIDKLVSEFGVDPEVAPGMLEPDENR